MSLFSAPPLDTNDSYRAAVFTSIYYENSGICQARVIPRLFHNNGHNYLKDLCRNGCRVVRNTIKALMPPPIDMSFTGEAYRDNRVAWHAQYMGDGRFHDLRMSELDALCFGPTFMTPMSRDIGGDLPDQVVLVNADREEAIIVNMDNEPGLNALAVLTYDGFMGTKYHSDDRRVGLWWMDRVFAYDADDPNVPWGNCKMLNNNFTYERCFRECDRSQ